MERCTGQRILARLFCASLPIVSLLPRRNTNELITKPRLNGVPLRRVSQAYVIATSTKVDVAGLKVPESVNDAYFAKAKSSKSTKEGEFFGEKGEKKAFPEDKKSEQKTVDAPVLEAVKKVDNLAKYLKASWGLSKGDRFHELKF